MVCGQGSAATGSTSTPFNKIPNEYAGPLLRRYVFEFAIDGVRSTSYLLFCSVILFGFNAPGELPKRPTSCAGMLFAVILRKSPDVVMLNSFAMLRFSEHSPLEESTAINSLQSLLESLDDVSESLSSQLKRTKKTKDSKILKITNNNLSFFIF